MEGDDCELHDVVCLLSAYAVAAVVSERNIWFYKRHDRSGAVGLYADGPAHQALQRFHRGQFSKETGADGLSVALFRLLWRLSAGQFAVALRCGQNAARRTFRCLNSGE